MDAVLASVVGGCFAVIVALIQKARKENKKDHGSVMDHLQLVSHEIRKDIRQVRYEVRDHRLELRDHIVRDHLESDSIRQKDLEADQP